MLAAKLREQISNTFNIEEIETLCFDLNIDKDNIAGESKLSKSRELVSYCERLGKLQELKLRCKELRPSLDWGLGQNDADLSPMSKQPSMRINLDAWLSRAYRINNFIDRLLRNQPFQEEDFLFRSLGELIQTSLDANLSVEVVSNTLGVREKLVDVEQLWVMLIVGSTVRLALNDTKWLVKETVNYLAQPTEMSSCRVEPTWRFVCQRYCSHSSETYDEAVLRLILEAAIERCDSKHTWLYPFFIFIYERLAFDAVTIKYVADFLESHAETVGRTATPAFLERLKRLIGYGRKLAFHGDEDIPPFTPKVARISASSLCDYEFEVMVYPLTNADFFSISGRLPKETNLADPYVFVVYSSNEKSPFSVLQSDAISIIELCRAFEAKNNEDFEWDIPTICEWLALADCETSAFPWGDELPTPERANLDFGGGTKLRPVGSYPLGATKLGIYDCCGNVHEIARISSTNRFPVDFRLMGGSFRTKIKDASCNVIRTLIDNQVLMRKNIGVRLVRYRKTDVPKRLGALRRFLVSRQTQEESPNKAWRTTT